MTATLPAVGHDRRGFQHEVLLYQGVHELVAGCRRFLGPAIEVGAPALVALESVRLDAVRSQLGAAPNVRYLPMEVTGRNPGRLIAAWRSFAQAHAGEERLWGIGEPVWSGRRPDELIECQRHEELLNVAFADEPRRFSLLCPYDASSLGVNAIDGALRSHPLLFERGARRDNPTFHGVRPLDTLTDPLAPAPFGAAELSFDRDALDAVRAAIRGAARGVGLDAGRTHDVVLAVNEMATNSVRHGGGSGLLRWWVDDDAVVAEVVDRGRLHDPLVGRRRPPAEAPSGRGLFLVHELCDLVQIRSGPGGTTVRVRVERHLPH